MVVTTKSFLFVGYLVQEPYLKDPKFPGMRLATIDRKIHPDFLTIGYDLVGGVANVTRFLTHLPDMSKYPGWILNGYAIESDEVKPELGIDRITVFPSKYEYAKRFERPEDGLSMIGFDLVDERTHPFSVLHFEDYTLDELTADGRQLNKWGLYQTVAAAETFRDFVLRVNQTEATIWQVWG
jgi:hypothetical protein